MKGRGIVAATLLHICRYIMIRCTASVQTSIHRWINVDGLWKAKRGVQCCSMIPMHVQKSVRSGMQVYRCLCKCDDTQACDWFGENEVCVPFYVTTRVSWKIPYPTLPRLSFSRCRTTTQYVKSRWNIVLVHILHFHLELQAGFLSPVALNHDIIDLPTCDDENQCVACICNVTEKGWVNVDSQ